MFVKTDRLCVEKKKQPKKNLLFFHAAKKKIIIKPINTTKNTSTIKADGVIAIEQIITISNGTPQQSAMAPTSISLDIFSPLQVFLITLLLTL